MVYTLIALITLYVILSAVVVGCGMKAPPKPPEEKVNGTVVTKPLLLAGR